MQLVGDICTRNVVTVVPSETLDKACEKMFINDISRLVVVEDGKPVGIVTEKDIAHYLVYADRPINQIKVSEVMKSPLITARLNDTIQEAAKRMLEHGISSLIIIEDSELKGIVTKSDIVKFCATLKGKWHVKDFMTRNPITVSSWDTVFKVVDLMVKRNVGRIIVTDVNDRPIGIITLADIVRAAPEISLMKLKSMGKPRILRPLLLRSIMCTSIMSRDLIVIRGDADLAEAAKAMVENGISGLPVIDGEGKLVGIITKTDITRAVSQL